MKHKLDKYKNNCETQAEATIILRTSVKLKRRLSTQKVELEYTTVTKTDGNQAKMKELVDTVAVNEPPQDEIDTLVDSLEWKKKKIYSASA